MNNRQEPVFTVNPNLAIHEIQDAIIQRIGSARAMATMLQVAEAEALGSRIPSLYGGALETMLEELDVLFDRLLKLVNE